MPDRFDRVLRSQPGWSAEEGAAFEPLPLHQQCRSYSVGRYDAFFFCRTSRVLRKRYDSAPVSMMCARSVIRSSNALHSLGLGNTVTHSEEGRLVVTIRAARSARSEIT